MGVYAGTRARLAFFIVLQTCWKGTKRTSPKILTKEEGKPLGESRGEVRRAVDETRFMAGEASRLIGNHFPSERRGVDVDASARFVGTRRGHYTVELPRHFAGS